LEGNNCTPSQQVFILALFVIVTIFLNHRQCIAMTAFAHTLVLAVSVYGRVIFSAITASIAKREPMISYYGQRVEGVVIMSDIFA
jgi:hypothetical protein